MRIQCNAILSHPNAYGSAGANVCVCTNSEMRETNDKYEQVKMRMQFTTILLICIEQFTKALAQGMPVSPCPKVFQYRFDGSEWFGLAAIRNPDVQALQIRITLSMRGKPTTVGASRPSNRTLSTRTQFALLSELPGRNRVADSGQVYEQCAGALQDPLSQTSLSTQAGAHLGQQSGHLLWICR